LSRKCITLYKIEIPLFVCLYKHNEMFVNGTYMERFDFKDVLHFLVDQVLVDFAVFLKLRFLPTYQFLKGACQFGLKKYEVLKHLLLVF